MQCEEWADANSELFKEAHDETVHKNSYKRKLYELISASLVKRFLFYLKIGEADTKERILMYRSGKGFAYCPVQEGHEFKIHGLRGAAVRP